MYDYIAIIFIILILYAIPLHLKEKRKNKLPTNLDEYKPYKPKKWLLTKSEQKFFVALNEAAKQEGLLISPKVRLWDLMYVEKGTDERKKYENKIRSKHIDFVLTDPKTSEVVLLIELDDKSHERADRKKSDEFKNNVAKTTGHKLMRVKVQKQYDLESMRKQIVEYKK